MAEDIIINVKANVNGATPPLKEVASELKGIAGEAQKADVALSGIGTKSTKGLQGVSQAASKAEGTFTSLANSGSKSIFILTEKLNELKSAVFTEKDIGKIKTYNKEISNTEKEIKKLEAAGTSSFGAIGQGAKGAFSAVRVLANILPGVGISGLLVFAIGPLVEYTGALFGITEESKEAAKEQKKFAEALNSVRESGISTGLQLQSFVTIARDQTQSLETRNVALENANKILGDHANKLTLVNVSTQEVTDTINKFTQATIQQSLATKFADRAAELMIKQQQASEGYAKAIKDGAAATTGFDKRLADLQRSLNAKAYIAFTNDLQKVVADLGAAQLKAATLFGEIAPKESDLGRIGQLRKQIEELTKLQPYLKDVDIAPNVEQIKKLQDELDALLGKTKKTATSTKKTISDVLSELAKEIDFLNKKEIAFKTNETKAKLAAYFSAIEKLIKDFKPKSTLIDKLFGEAADIRILDALKKIYPKADDIPPIEIPVTFAPASPNEHLSGVDSEAGLPAQTLPDKTQLEKATVLAELQGLGVKKAFVKGFKSPIPIEYLTLAEAEAAKADAQEKIKDLNDIFRNGAIGIGESFATGLGKALAGGGIGSIFDALFKSFASNLKELGNYFIKTAVQVELFKKLVTNSPLAAIGIGVALVALGSLIESKLSSAPKFATGGLVGGTGNRDTVNALLTPGEFVMTQSAVKRIGVDNLAAMNRGSNSAAMIGSGIEGGALSVNASIVGLVSGKDLRLILNRADASLGRVG